MTSVSGVEFLEYFAFVFGSEELVGVDADLQNILSQLDGSPLSNIHALKEFGNSLFREHQFAFAGDCYDQACRQLGVALKNNFEPDLNSIIPLAVSLCLNLAACSNKIQAFDGALLFCTTVLTFFPTNAKALFRKAVPLRHLNRFSEATVTLKEAQVIEPHNKDIIRELTALAQALEINQNGKRVVAEQLDDIEVRAAKKCVSSPPSQAAGSEINMETGISSSGVCSKDSSSALNANPAPCFNQVQMDQFLSSNNLQVEVAEYTADCATVRSPIAPMDSMESESSSTPGETLADASDGHLSSSTSPHFTFINKKRPHNPLHLSSQAYEKLLHGQNLGFYHPRSMSFMRVRTLTPKTIQTGTPHEEISGTAEVPKSSLAQENFVQEEAKLVQEEVIFQVDKKARLNSASFCVSKVSLVQFKFTAVRAFREPLQTSKAGCRSHEKVRRSRPTTCSKKRQSLSVGFSSSSLCRYTHFIATVSRMKRKGVQSIEFDAQYHRPFKKYCVDSSITSTVSTVYQVFTSSGGSQPPLFVI